MRARTIGQIAALIADHMGGAPAGARARSRLPAEPSPAEEVDLEALSNEEIDRLLGGQADAEAVLEIDAARLRPSRNLKSIAMSEDRRTRLKRWLESGEISLQPLTFPQRELWEASPVPVADPSNHICAFIEVRGLLTAEDCQAACNEWWTGRK